MTFRITPKNQKCIVEEQYHEKKLGDITIVLEFDIYWRIGYVEVEEDPTDAIDESKRFSPGDFGLSNHSFKDGWLVSVRNLFGVRKGERGEHLVPDEERRRVIDTTNPEHEGYRYVESSYFITGPLDIEEVN